MIIFLVLWSRGLWSLILWVSDNSYICCYMLSSLVFAFKISFTCHYNIWKIIEKRMSSFTNVITGNIMCSHVWSVLCVKHIKVNISKGVGTSSPAVKAQHTGLDKHDSISHGYLSWDNACFGDDDMNVYQSEFRNTWHEEFFLEIRMCTKLMTSNKIFSLWIHKEAKCTTLCG